MSDGGNRIGTVSSVDADTGMVSRALRREYRWASTFPSGWQIICWSRWITS